MQTRVSIVTAHLLAGSEQILTRTTDENRARIVEGGHINAIIDLLRHESLLPYVVTVLYNVSVDYGKQLSPVYRWDAKAPMLTTPPEPVQLQASEAGLSQRLIDLLEGPRLETSRPLIGLICKVLALLITQEPEARIGSSETPRVLLSIATDQEHPVEVEDFSALVSVALAYLTHETFQASNLASVPLLLEAFSMSHTAFDPSDTDDPDAAAQLKQVRTAFVPVLADISALPDFITVPTQGADQAQLLEHPVLKTLQGWLRGPPENATLQSAACLALGNVARSDATCETLVGGAAIHEPLIELLARCTGSGTATTASPTNSQLTHAVISFLKNLAIPAANKPALGRLLELGLLPKLWSTWGDAQPQSQFAAVSLGRLLLVGCPPNVARLCTILERDTDAPDNTRRTSLHVLLGLFSRSDVEPTKTEVARAAANVCRALHSAPVESVLSEGWEAPPPTSSAEDQREGDSTTQETPNHTSGATTGTTTEDASSSSPAEVRRVRFYNAHEPALLAALSFLLTQSRFPALRSEAWFVLALTARRSPSGARLARAVLDPTGACRALVEAVTGRRDISDGDDMLLAASSSGDDGDAVEDVLSNSTGGGGAGAQQGQAQVATVGGVSIGVEGLGLGEGGPGDLQPRQVDPAARAGMARVDRENALCLVAELVRDGAGELDPARRAVYERLLATGWELVQNSRGEVAGG